MKRAGWMVLGAFLLALPARGAIPIDGVAARVNGHVITLSDVLGSSSELQALLRQGQDAEAANAAYDRVLQEWISRKLIVDAYDAQKEIQIPEEAIDAQVDEIIHDMFGGDRNAFLQALGDEGRSEASWRAEIREQIVIRAMRNLRVDRHVRISPTEIRARYVADPDRYATAPAWTYRMIVVRGSDAGELPSAQAAVETALQAGESFASVAKRLSEDAQAEQGGLRGPVDPGQLRPGIRDVLQDLAEGEQSDAIALGPHTVWVQMVAREEAQQPDYEDVYAQIRNVLFRERADALYQSWIDRLQAQAFVSVVVSAPF